MAPISIFVDEKLLARDREFRISASSAMVVIKYTRRVSNFAHTPTEHPATKKPKSIRLASIEVGEKKLSRQISTNIATSIFLLIISSASFLCNLRWSNNVLNLI